MQSSLILVNAIGKMQAPHMWARSTDNTYMEWVREEVALEKCVKGCIRFKDGEKHIRDEREGVPAGKKKKKKNPQHKTRL